MYPTWLRKLLFYFDLWGFCTQFKPHPKQQKIDFFILFVHIVLALISTILIFTYLTRPIDDTLGTLNDTLKFTVLLVSYWLSIFELYFNKKILQNYWKLFEFMDHRFSSHQQFLLGNYLFKMKIYFVVSMSANCVYFQRLISNSGIKFLYFWISYVFVVLFYQNRSFYYLFFLEIVSYELNQIDREINQILSDCDNLNNKFIRKKRIFIEEFCHNRFKWIRNYYQSIYDLNGIINKIFGWSNVVTILLSFHLVLADVNWFYWKLLNKYEFSILGNRSFLLV